MITKYVRKPRQIPDLVDPDAWGVESGIFNCKTVEIKPGLYCRPHDQRVESINVGQGQGEYHELFQTTVAKQYGIQVKGLQDTSSAKYMKTKVRLKVHFVVAEDIFLKVYDPPRMEVEVQ